MEISCSGDALYCMAEVVGTVKPSARRRLQKLLGSLLRMKSAELLDKNYGSYRSSGPGVEEVMEEGQVTYLNEPPHALAKIDISLGWLHASAASDAE